MIQCLPWWLKMWDCLHILAYNCKKICINCRGTLKAPRKKKKNHIFGYTNKRLPCDLVVWDPWPPFINHLVSKRICPSFRASKWNTHIMIPASKSKLVWSFSKLNVKDAYSFLYIFVLGTCKWELYIHLEWGFYGIWSCFLHHARIRFFQYRVPSFQSRSPVNFPSHWWYIFMHDWSFNNRIKQLEFETSLAWIAFLISGLFNQAVATLSSCKINVLRFRL